MAAMFKGGIKQISYGYLFCHTFLDTAEGDLCENDNEKKSLNMKIKCYLGHELYRLI